MAEEERSLELLTIADLMQREQGRDFLWRCLTECGTFSDIFDPDQVRHAYLSGKRAFGLWLESEMKEASPDLYMQMRKEHINE